LNGYVPRQCFGPLIKASQLFPSSNRIEPLEGYSSNFSAN
jgi:hypothetical protein